MSWIYFVCWVWENCGDDNSKNSCTGVQTNIFPWLLLTKADSGGGGVQKGQLPLFLPEPRQAILMPYLINFNTYNSYGVQYCLLLFKILDLPTVLYSARLVYHILSSLVMNMSKISWKLCKTECDLGDKE